MPRVQSKALEDALAGAASAFAERGLDGTRMEDIAAATGVPRATLYYHFASKEEILTWLLDRLLQRLADEVGTILDGDGSARVRLEAIVKAYLRLFADHPDLCQVLLSDLGRVTRIPVLADSIRAAFHEPVAKLLDAGERDGTLRSISHEAGAAAVFGAITMVGLHYVVTGRPVDVDRVALQLVDLLVGGLGTGER